MSPRALLLALPFALFAALLPALLMLAAGDVSAAPAAPMNRTSAACEPTRPSTRNVELDSGPPSKKQIFLAQKRARPDVHARRPENLVAKTPLSVRNMWTLEELPVDPAEPPSRIVWSELLRDHFTNQSTTMDPRLSSVILAAAKKFAASYVEVVSGYRAPKYNLMLRKKGHAVARESQHPLGHAVDFRMAGVGTRELFRFVRSLHLGGAGYYPQSGFVHADVGPVRTWIGH